jgi:nucleoside-diphosphate-sugar epimerase
MRNTALVIGATGVSGRALIEHLETRDDWTIYGISRTRPDHPTTAIHVGADLSDPEAARRAFADLGDVTHVFHCAFVNRPGWAAQVAPNLALLVNAVDAIEPVARGLRHVCLLQGTKYYGCHLGPFRTPAKEDQPRHAGPNFYFDQQDFLAARQRGKRWSWSCARPHTICGFAVGNPLNLVSVLGAYAAISRELGLPLRFPGNPSAFRAVYQCTDAGLLARAMGWMATDPACANQAFNITNGDFVRFENLWPVFARAFGMEPGPVHRLELERFMADKTPLWDAIVARHGLAAHPFARVADWSYADYAFGFAWDIMSDTSKCRRFGFHEFVDTEEMFLRLFDRLRQERVNPSVSAPDGLPASAASSPSV